VKLLIVVVVAAGTAVLVVLALRNVDGPWRDDTAIRTAIAGAAAGVMSLVASRKLRKD